MRLENAVRKAAGSRLNLRYFGGRTWQAMTFVNLYAGGDSAWDASDRSAVDHALGAAMSDAGLNNMLAQYFGGTAPTTVMLPSVVLPEQCPARVGKDTVEGWVTAMSTAGQLPEAALASTMYCFMLPRGIILSDGPASGGATRPATEIGEHDAADSTSGLGGYHGSVHVGGNTVYYAVGVYSDATNGINGFPDASWKNICATFYHELNEARTDPDVEDAANAASGGDHYLGWYSLKGGEIGDIPMDEAGTHLSTVMTEVPLADGSGDVPIQLMWSNAAGAPQGPVDHPLQPTKARG
ncbi:MAG TPA: hypothetical protein VKU39_04500 [Streptosporangiaceae bacterium]|nr:hypothetical protein [Streptosporangiaceae bacterium]